MVVVVVVVVVIRMVIINAIPGPTHKEFDLIHPYWELVIYISANTSSGFSGLLGGGEFQRPYLEDPYFQGCRRVWTRF